MTVTSDGKVVKTIQVSLGAAKTPTYSGTKVVMQKGEDVPGTDTRKPDGIVHMVGPGYSEDVKWSTRVTSSGEYIHGAPWNTHIGQHQHVERLHQPAAGHRAVVLQLRPAGRRGDLQHSRCHHAVVGRLRLVESVVEHLEGRRPAGQSLIGPPARPVAPA